MRLPPRSGVIPRLISPRFCEQDEDHDPSVEFEEYLACAVCGDNGELLSCCVCKQSRKADKAAAHRQCARDNDALKSDDGELGII